MSFTFCTERRPRGIFWWAYSEERYVSELKLVLREGSGNCLKSRLHSFKKVTDGEGERCCEEEGVVERVACRRGGVGKVCCERVEGRVP